MRRAIRILVVGLFALSILVPAAPLAVAVDAPAGYSAADQPTATPTNTAPAGPNLNPEQAPNKSRQKVVIGVLAVLLLVIVFLGRRSKNKRKKKASSATVT